MKFQVKTHKNPKGLCRTCPQRSQRKCDLCAKKRERLYKSQIEYFENLNLKSS